jgi:hypothetical protein
VEKEEKLKVAEKEGQLGLREREIHRGCVLSYLTFGVLKALRILKKLSLL